MKECVDCGKTVGHTFDLDSVGYIHEADCFDEESTLRRLTPSLQVLLRVSLSVATMFFGVSCGGSRFIVGDQFVDNQTSVDQLVEERPWGIGGNLYLVGYDGELHGLERLTDVAGDVYIAENFGDGSVDGLETLREIAGDLIIEAMTTPTDVSLPALVRIGGDLVVRASAIRTLELGRLEEIGGDVVFVDVSELTSLEVSDNLRVGGTVEIRGCAELAPVVIEATLP